MISATTTQNARLACTHAANASMHVVDQIHNAAGTSGMRMSSPLERKLRDAHGCATHRWVAHPLYAELGRIFLGHEAPPAEKPGVPAFLGVTVFTVGSSGSSPSSHDPHERQTGLSRNGHTREITSGARRATGGRSKSLEEIPPCVIPFLPSAAGSRSSNSWW